MNNIIEPCCAERQLGRLLRENIGHAVMFQTQGDVTVTILLKATILMSGDRPRTLTIAAPSLPTEAMRTVERYAQLGYISTLRLMLQEQPDVNMFSDFGVEVQLAITPNVPSLLMWQGSLNTVAIQGAIPDTITHTLHLYAAILGGNQSLHVRNAIDPFESLFRARRVELISTTQEDNKIPTISKKSNRKPKKSNDVEPTEQVEGTPQAEESTEATA